MSIAGARPNFMKLASIADAVKKHNANKNRITINHIIVHTGQHYDKTMSESFFTDLGIPEPDINLGVGSGTHASQTAAIIKNFEPVLLQFMPDVLLVVGDVNSTIACTLVASKINYPENHHVKRPIIVHVEAGLRSFDRDMPEEINRILTDALSDLLFVTEESGLQNLQKEGVAQERIHLVGNVMIDTLQQHLEKAKQSNILQQLGITGKQKYGIVTLHRPSNVDTPASLKPLIDCLVEISRDIQLIFPLHPRTRNKARDFGLLNLLEDSPNILLTEPLGYLDFLNLISNATVIITDSGGIQEESTYLGIPCITLRENTERPVTVDIGSNYLIGTDPEKIKETCYAILSGQGKKAVIPPLWDGLAGERILQLIIEAAMPGNDPDFQKTIQNNYALFLMIRIWFMNGI